MKNDKQKKKGNNKSKKQNKYRALSLVLTSSLVIAPLTVPLTFYLPGGITASAAILDAEILSNITSSNNSGTTSGSPWASDGSTKNVDFTISGSALVGGSVINTGTKQGVLTIPTELNGKVTPNGSATINTNVTITVGQVSFLTNTLTAANNLATLLTQITSGTVASLTGVTLDLTAVQQQLNLLNNIENFGSASFSSTPTLSADGSYISANIDDGLGLVLSQNVTTILQDLKSAVDALHATGIGLTGPASALIINTALAPVKLAVDTAIDVALPLVQAGGTGFNQLLDASVLGSTTIDIPTTVVSPTNLSQNLDAKFVGTVVQTDTIDVNLLNTANGVSDIYYAGTAVVVPAPIVTNTTGTSTTGYTVTGTATAGDTVNILNAGGTVIGTATADGSGNFSATIPQGQATASEALTAVAVDGSGNQSTPTPFTTPADPTAVAAPVVTNTTGTSGTGYTVTGTATAGNTVNILNAGGTVIGTATADGSGNFSATIPQGQATASEALKAVAVDGSGNQSTPTPFTTPADPVVIPAPTVTGVTGTSATGYTVTGTAPAGDTVSIKNAGGTIIGTATADASGNFTVTIPTGLATPEEALTATASDGNGNQSPATPFTTPADPVVVPAPTVTSVTGNSATGYTVTGTATPGNTVSIKNPGGTVIGTAIADPSGNYTAIVPVGLATPNEQLTAVATDGAGNSSTGTPFTTPADPVVVPAPTVTGVTGTFATGYTVTGTATPGDTVTIKNTGGTVIGTAVANAGGNYTVTIPAGLATPVEQLKAIASDPAGNQSTATPFTTPADPVVVPAPTVTSVTGNSGTGYTVTGTAPAGDVVTVKNAGGTVIGTAIADPSGNYTLVIPTGAASPNEQLTATATDGAGNTSAGTSFVTPADPVVVP
ncbi:adhesive domain-containing protein, partial [Enterococcus quebecensis]